MKLHGFEMNVEITDWTLGNRGICDDEPIPSPGSWSFTTPATALGRSNSAKAYILSAGGSNELEVVNWKATAATTDLVQFTMQVPWRMRKYSGSSKSGMKLALRVRRVDTTGGATDDTDLGLSVLAIFQSPTLSDRGVETDGTAFVTSTADTYKPATATADNAPGKFRTVFFDLFKDLTDAQKAAIVPGSTVTIRIAPTKTVGTALALQVITGGRLVMQKHPAPMRWISNLLRV